MAALHITHRTGIAKSHLLCGGTIDGLRLPSSTVYFHGDRPLGACCHLPILIPRLCFGLRSLIISLCSITA